MKPSKDLDEQIDEILDHLMQYSFDYGAEKIPTSDDPPLIIARQAKQQLLALIEQKYGSHKLSYRRARKGQSR